MARAAVSDLARELNLNSVTELSDINIGSKGSAVFFNALATNISLRSLRLENNGLDAESCRHLAQALRTNHTLKKLILFRNQIDDQGLAWLGPGIEANDSLEHLDLRFNPYTPQGLGKFLNHLSRNSSIMAFDCFNATPPDVARIEVILNRNTRRKDVREGREMYRVVCEATSSAEWVEEYGSVMPVDVLQTILKYTQGDYARMFVPA
eukprot:TRINITY_DN721_c0_g1_i3.p1 TRINITY_DN721_c0_g1~~TRINITY_DN721_c0_g1_i3.p1  ORF type:complete len:208 (-),score=23.77 TRINITY_DN721_c0_g1_i3:147-770(-)